MERAGGFEVWSEAIGEALNELAGFRLSRLTANVARGDATFPVESTLGWPTKNGRVVVDGTTYTYQSATSTTLEGLRWQDGIYTPAATSVFTATGQTFQLTVRPGSALRVSLRGTWAGSIVVQQSSDGIAWTTIGSPFTVNAVVQISPDAPNVRLLASALSSGRVQVVVENVTGAQPEARQVPTVTVLSAVGTNLAIVVSPFTVLGLSITGTWVGTLVLEQSADGITWTTVATYTGNATEEPTVTQTRVRVRASAWTSGKATVSVAAIARAGAQDDLPVATHVVDYSRTFNALDAIRSQLFVDTATGDFLSALGRNLGVQRPPDLPDDDKFRRVIKAMAYLPKGTMQGLEIALTAFFGTGNFRVWEDFASGFRNRVFIELAHALATNLQGRALLARETTTPLHVGVKTVTLPAAGAFPQVNSNAPWSVRTVRLADEGRSDALGAVKPSGLIETLYDGGPTGPVWAFSGTSETDVVASADYGSTITTPAGRTAAYVRTARIRPESDATLDVLVTPVALTGTSGTSGRQWSMAIRDGARDLAVGLIKSGSDFQIGFIDSAGSFFAGAARVLALGTQVALKLRKRGSVVELLVDGSVCQTADASDFDATVLNEFRFGHQDAAAAVTSVVRAVSFSAQTLTDFWNISGVGSAPASGTVDTASGLVQVGDSGKTLRTVSGTPGVERNTGFWKVATVVDTNQVTVEGITRGGLTIESLPATHGRMTVAGVPDAFTFPDDVGKYLEVLDVTDAGNNGLWPIVSIRRADDPTKKLGFDDSDHPVVGSLRQSSNICEVGPGPVGGFDPEAGQHWRLMPNFGTDPALYWEMSSTGTLVGLLATLRANPPLNIPGGYVVVMDVAFTTVRSAQVLPSEDVANKPANTWWPAYLPAHPFGPYRIYLDQLTVAGVVPVISYPTSA